MLNRIVKNLLFFLMLIVQFGFSAKGPIGIGLEVGKYPVNFAFSKMFDQSHVDFIISKIERDPWTLLDMVSNDDEETLTEYINEHYTLYSFNKDNFSMFLKPLLMKFFGTGAILAGQQIFPEHNAKAFQVTDTDDFYDLFLPWGFPVETGMRLANNLACAGYGIKTEGGTGLSVI